MNKQAEHAAKEFLKYKKIYEEIDLKFEVGSSIDANYNENYRGNTKNEGVELGEHGSWSSHIAEETNAVEVSREGLTLH